MELTTYQAEALRYSVYPEQGNNFVFPVLALSEEVGELAGKCKKLMRDKGVFTPSQMAPEDRDALVKEIGDVLWYLAALAAELGSNLDEVAQQNLNKIASRRERGVVGGSGDSR